MPRAHHGHDVHRVHRDLDAHRVRHGLDAHRVRHGLDAHRVHRGLDAHRVRRARGLRALVALGQVLLQTSHYGAFAAQARHWHLRSVLLLMLILRQLF